MPKIFILCILLHSQGICCLDPHWQSTIVASEILSIGIHLKSVRGIPLWEDCSYFRKQPGPFQDNVGTGASLRNTVSLLSEKLLLSYCLSQGSGLYQLDLKMEMEVILAKWEIRPSWKCWLLKDGSMAEKEINKTSWNCRAQNCLHKINPYVFFSPLKILTITSLLRFLTQHLEPVIITCWLKSQNVELKRSTSGFSWFPQPSQYFKVVYKATILKS